MGLRVPDGCAWVRGCQMGANGSRGARLVRMGLRVGSRDVRWVRMGLGVSDGCAWVRGCMMGAHGSRGVKLVCLGQQVPDGCKWV